MVDYNQLRFLPRIQAPNDLHSLTKSELSLLADEIRRYTISTVSKNGGHLASNLGVVELTIALHLCFDFSKDKLVFDVGHQSYTHKLITGRAGEFASLRQKDGIAGFPKTEESPYDVFNVGHSSTSVSAALGMLRAMHLKGEDDRRVVALLGDGALTGGLAYEAIDDAGEQELPLIVVLNDNKMSIAGNIGGVSGHLSKLRTSKGYKRFKRGFSGGLKRIPFVGVRISNRIEKLKNRIKYFILPNVLFEELGFTYVGPLDGHDISKLTDIFNQVKLIKDKPVLVHVVTEKGKGYVHAEKNPEKFHGIGAFDESTGVVKSGNSNSKVFADELCRLAEKNNSIVAITAAMANGTGLSGFRDKFPDRFFDVGIAEQHGVTMAAGMAAAGLIPVFVVYSTFLQRGYDQILHDVCLQNLPVVFAIDRAGLVGADGETHQGVYDIAYIMTMPNGITLFSPSSTEELCAMLDEAVTLKKPTAIRYNRGILPSRPLNTDFRIDEWETISEIRPVTVVATGRMVEVVESACRGLDVGLVNARVICPIKDGFVSALNGASYIITIEDGNLDTGFGAQLSRLIAAKHGNVIIENLGVPNIPIESATVREQDEFCGLTAESIREKIIHACTTWHK